jgi:hypothetical protein
MMKDDTGGGGYDQEADEEFVAQNVFSGKGDTLDEAMSDAAGKALRRHPEGTRFDLTRLQVKIYNPRVSDYRIHLSTSSDQEP